jgi:hypothetical protein
MLKTSPNKLQQIRSKYQQSKADFISRCNSAVVQWRAATQRMVHAEPLLDQVDRRLEDVSGWRAAQGVWLEKPRKGKSTVVHGFDGAGQLRVVDTGFTKSYIDYRASYIDEITDGRELQLNRYLLDAEAGNISAIYEVKPTSCTLETFTRDKNGLIKTSAIRTWLRKGKTNVFNESEYLRAYHYEYGSDRQLTRVVRESISNGESWRREIIFSRPGSQTLESALSNIEDFLVDQVPKSVRGLGLTSPVCAIGLTYCGEDITSGWPGVLLVWTVDQRKQILGDQVKPTRGAKKQSAAAGKKAKREHFFMKVLLQHFYGMGEEDSCTRALPAEQAAQLELEEKACYVMELLQQSEDDEDPTDVLRNVLRQAARRLNDQDWRDVTPVSKDFLVTPVDDHGETQVFDDFRASLSPTKTKHFQSLGLV